MEDKIKIIDAIIQLHPSFGVDKEWSTYTGGMGDAGSWHFRRMLDVPIEELQAFWDAYKFDLIETQPKESKAPIVVELGRGAWTTKAEIDAIEALDLYIKGREAERIWPIEGIGHNAQIVESEINATKKWKHDIDMDAFFGKRNV